jgi:hypothetical protein
MGRPTTPITFYGWYDPDATKPVMHKLTEAMAGFTAKYGTRPRHCLCSQLDAEHLETANPPLAVTGRHYIARHTFYVGHPDVWELREADDDLA